MRRYERLTAVCLSLCLLCQARCADLIEAALSQAGTNRIELEQALQQVPEAQRPGLEFLIANMPAPDLQNLGTAYLLENTRLAYAAFAEAPWRDRVSQDLFLNDVLPYACANERREAWRKILHEKAAPLVQECASPGEAALRLNQRLFPSLNVRYSTQRRRPDQSPLETMESGRATCTGLAILLVDACRSVGIPARLVGTPSWADGRGNHTWVEVWDGDWHFLGAAEPDPQGLDRGWFVADAARAIQDVRAHAIYASSFRKTGLSFPLVWARRVDWVSAVNVTDRYTAKAKPADDTKARLMVRVLDGPQGARVAATVRLLNPTNGTEIASGTSRDEGADLNDLLSLEVNRGQSYTITAQKNERVGREQFGGTTEAQAQVTVHLKPSGQQASAVSETNVLSPDGVASAAGPIHRGKLTRREVKRLHDALADYFQAPPSERERWKFASSLDRWLQKDEEAVRQVAWAAYRSAPIHPDLQADYQAQLVRNGRHVSPYTVKSVGTKPSGGWPLFIAMHGGGNAPKRVNDQQWGVMQRYYRDHPELGGYLYLALRAPNDTWNGFYDDYVYPLVANLIRQFLLFGDVDSNRVFLLGYSHGGYGAFAIGPKLPDRFAAIHASAAAPTDGETSAKTLRNTRFTYMIGEKDLAYGRLDRCRAFDATIQKLRADRTDIYPVTMEYQAGHGHVGLPDRDKIGQLYPAIREPVPRELSWELTDPVVADFYWLRAPKPGKGQEIEAVCRDNQVIVKTRNVLDAELLLDSRLVDFDRSVRVEVNGRTREVRLRPSLRVLAETMLLRGDPWLAFSARLVILERYR